LPQERSNKARLSLARFVLREAHDLAPGVLGDAPPPYLR